MKLIERCEKKIIVETHKRLENMSESEWDEYKEKIRRNGFSFGRSHLKTNKEGYVEEIITYKKEIILNIKRCI